MPKLSDEIARPYELKLYETQTLIESIALSTSVPEHMKIQLSSSIKELWKLRCLLVFKAHLAKANDTETQNSLAPQIDAEASNNLELPALMTSTTDYIKLAEKQLAKLASEQAAAKSKDPKLEHKFNIQKEYAAALTVANKELLGFKKAVEKLVALNVPDNKISTVYPIAGACAGGMVAFGAMPAIFGATILKGGLYFSGQTTGNGGAKAAAFVGGGVFGAFAGIPVAAASILACGTLGAHLTNKNINDTYRCKVNVIYNLVRLSQILHDGSSVKSSLEFWQTYYASLLHTQTGPKLRNV